MSQKRIKKQLKRRRHKEKDAVHFKMREYSRLAKELLGEAVRSK